MKKFLAKLHRLRLAKTRYWLPFEKEIHQALLADRRLTRLHKFIKSQVAHLFEAYRSTNVNELAANFSYQGGARLWNVHKSFTLCHISSSSVNGTIRFGGGMLAAVHIRPEELVINPKKFQLKDFAIHDVFVPQPVPLPTATAWVLELEESGKIVRYEGPTDQDFAITQGDLHPQYAELFSQCSSASVQIQDEAFHFVSPSELSVIDDGKIGPWVPIVDLRELGGLAITQQDDGKPVISYINATIEWSEPGIRSAIERLHKQFST